MVVLILASEAKIEYFVTLGHVIQGFEKACYLKIILTN